MLKQLWKWRIIRIISGVTLLLIGIVAGLIPGPGGFIFWLPGLIILLADVPFLRKIVACILKFLRKFKFARLFIRKSRLLIIKATGWKIWFKKRKKNPPTRKASEDNNDRQ